MSRRNDYANQKENDTEDRLAEYKETDEFQEYRRRFQKPAWPWDHPQESHEEGGEENKWVV